jgi:hypothetical protein
MLALQEPPDGLIQPVIDGIVSSPNEWQNAGRCCVREGPDTLYSRSSPIRDLRYGSDDRNMYFRIDWREPAGPASPLELHLRLRTPAGSQFHVNALAESQGASVVKMNLPEGAVTVASKDIYEMRISMEALHLRRGDSLFVHLEIYRDGVPHFVLPPGSELELPWSMMAAYAV